MKSLLAYEGGGLPFSEGKDLELTVEEIKKERTFMMHQLQSETSKSEKDRLSAEFQTLNQRAVVRAEERFQNQLITRNVDLENIISFQEKDKLVDLIETNYRAFWSMAIKYGQNKIKQEQLIKAAKDYRQIHQDIMSQRMAFAAGATLKLMHDNNLKTAIFVWGRGDSEYMKKAIETINQDKKLLQECFGDRNIKVNLFVFDTK